MACPTYKHLSSVLKGYNMLKLVLTELFGLHRFKAWAKCRLWHNEYECVRTENDSIVVFSKCVDCKRLTYRFAYES